jgi:hypothetical protein
MLTNAIRVRAALATNRNLDMSFIDLFRVSSRRFSSQTRNFTRGLALGLTICAASSVASTEPSPEPNQQPETSAVQGALAAMNTSGGPTKVTEPVPKSQGTRFSVLSNPGKYEELGRECKETLMLDSFKGARFSITKGILTTSSKQLVLSGQVQMGSEHLPEQHIVEYNAQLAANKHRLFASLDSTYRACGRYMYALTDNLDLRLLFQSSLERQHQYEAGVDFKTAESYTHATVSALTEMMGSAQSLKVQHLHSIRPDWSVGAELLHYFENKTLLTFVGRYRHVDISSGEGNIVTFTVPFDPQDGRYGCSYTRKLSERLTLATEGHYFHPKHESSANVGMLYHGTTFRFQANVDSEYHLSATLEQAITAVLRFIFSGDINHSTHESSFGFGLNVGA